MVHLILTCEHGGHDVPAEYQQLFVDATETLRSHRGWDPGALDLARLLEQQLSAPLIFSTTTRLFVELNRSVGHPRLFSEFTSGLDPLTKESILTQYYAPYRENVESAIEQQVKTRESVIHLSVHTFVPVLNGVSRTSDVGLLYDPARPIETELCGLWKQTLKTQRPDLRVRRNYPYLGKADGFTTHLRRQFSSVQYAGIELEVNQCWLDDPVSWRQLSDDLSDSLREVLTISPEYSRRNQKERNL